MAAKACARCGEDFGGTSPFAARGQVYCSPICRKRAERARARHRTASSAPNVPPSLARLLQNPAAIAPSDTAASSLLHAVRLARGQFGDRALIEWLRDAADHLEAGCLATLPPLHLPKL